MQRLSVDVCLTPELYHLSEDKEAIVVVIDILRATSAICTAFETGVEKMIPVATLEAARAFKDKGYIVGAERDGMQVEGFDFGNSPYSYKEPNLKGKTVVITTTNGTKSINIAKEAHQLLIGAFTNITALTDYLLKEKRNVILLCSGWKGKFNLEDALFAGAVAEILSKDEAFVDFSDSALATNYLYQTALKDPYIFLSNSSHRKRLAKLKLKKDIKYCLQFDQTQIIPEYKEGFLIRMS